MLESWLAKRRLSAAVCVSLLACASVAASDPPPYVTSRSTDDLVFVSGQIGFDPGEPGVTPDFEQQMRTTLDRLLGALEAACSAPAHVLRTTVYLADPSNAATMNRLYREFFDAHDAPLPARSLVPGLDFGNGIAVEIDAVARRAACAPALRTSYVAIAVAGKDGQRLVGGRLQYPLEHAAPMPAVLILHGSAGLDSRGEVHARALNALGFATLELDLWAARGWVAARSGRPEGVPETLPDAFAALDYLAAMPEVDASRIGVAGFSWGGVMAVLAAAEANANRYSTSEQRFAAHAAFYPVCWVYDRVPGYELDSLTQAPLLILTGARDDYDAPASCPDLAARYDGRNIHVVVYPDAYHGFNAVGLDAVVADPFSHQGRGGEVRMRSNPAARASAIERLDDFFVRHLQPGG
jgi:uncharacterized protein